MALRLARARGGRNVRRPMSWAPPLELLQLALAVGVRVVDGVAAGDRLPRAVLAARAGRQALDRADLDLVAAVGALVGAGGDVAAGRDWIGHAPGATRFAAVQA